MTHIEQAIKEAVEKGGYRDDFVAYLAKANVAVLDPSFWQARVRARHPDWVESAVKSAAKIDNKNLVLWLHKEKPAESFFATLV